MSAKPAQPEIVRSAEQLQQAHDLLTFFLANKRLQAAVLGVDPADAALRDATLKSMISTRDLLCWLLGHDDYTFPFNMIKLEAALMAEGYEVEDIGHLVHPEENGNGSLPS